MRTSVPDPSVIRSSEREASHQIRRLLRWVTIATLVALIALAYFFLGVPAAAF